MILPFNFFSNSTILREILCNCTNTYFLNYYIHLLVRVSIRFEKVLRTGSVMFSNILENVSIIFLNFKEY